MSAARGDAFHDVQAAHFTEADPAHFAWQVAGLAFAEHERALLAPVAAGFAAPYLEIGSGEGANFVHVGGGGLRVGIDRFPRKLAFAAQQVRGARFAAADARLLPFRDATFRTVLVRDVLHHVPDPGGVLAEAVRVLVPGGTLFVLEPNGRNPLVALQGRLVRAEAGVRTSGRAALAILLAALPLEDVTLEMAHPLPVRRLVLHYRMGFPGLGGVRPVAWLLDAVEGAAARVLPRDRWSYVLARGRRGRRDPGAV